MAKFNEEEIAAALRCNEGFKALSAILSVREEWRREIIQTYLYEPLKEFIESKNQHVKEVGKKFSVTMETYGDFCIYRGDWKHSSIIIGVDNDLHRNYYSIKVNHECENICKRGIRLQHFKDVPDLNNYEDYPYGWSYLSEEYYNWGYRSMPSIRKGILIEDIKKNVDDILMSIKNELNDFLP